MTSKPVTGTLWVLLTLVGVVLAVCSVACVIGLTTYQINDQVQQP